MYAYSNNGLSFRAWKDPGDLMEGEVFFDHQPTDEEIANAFPGYAAASALLAVPGQSAALMAGGLTFTWSANAALDGTYDVDPVQQQRIQAIGAGIAAGKGLPHGATTIAWPDHSGVPHLFTQDEFLDFGKACEDFVYDILTTESAKLQGIDAEWPATSVTIP